MADFGWVGDLEGNFLNIGAITALYFKKDRDREFTFIFCATNNGGDHKLFDLPRVGEIVSTPMGDVTMTEEHAAQLLEEVANLFKKQERMTNEEFKDDLITALGNF